MFQNPDKANGVDTFLGPSMKAEGTLTSAGTIVVEGVFSGTLVSEQDVTVGKNAKITASVQARNVKVAGEVRGDIHAHERLELEVTARVMGDIEAKTVRIAEGAVLQGKCSMISAKETFGAESRKAVAAKRIVAVGTEAANV